MDLKGVGIEGYEFFLFMYSNFLKDKKIKVSIFLSDFVVVGLYFSWGLLYFYILFSGVI